MTSIDQPPANPTNPDPTNPSTWELFWCDLINDGGALSYAEVPGGFLVRGADWAEQSNNFPLVFIPSVTTKNIVVGSNVNSDAEPFTLGKDFDQLFVMLESYKQGKRTKAEARAILNAMLVQLEEG